MGAAWRWKNSNMEQRMQMIDEAWAINKIRNGGFLKSKFSAQNLFYNSIPRFGAPNSFATPSYRNQNAARTNVARYGRAFLMISNLFSLLLSWSRRLIWLMRGRPRLSRVDTPTSDDRTVRLFVSSTFQDMQEERRTLQNDVFPIVRRFLWERGITFIDVDLRWGVTREEAEHGDVLDICLREIDRCRPWVLGLLGARYGWVDPCARERLRSDPRFFRLVDYADVSVTELELRHAITDRPPGTPAPAALLYWRVTPAADTPFKALVTDINAAGARNPARTRRPPDIRRGPTRRPAGPDRGPDTTQPRAAAGAIFGAQSN